MGIEQMKIEIAKIYGMDFVKNKPERQIIAIYYNMLRSGKFEKERISDVTKPKKLQEKYHQITIGEYLRKGGIL